MNFIASIDLKQSCELIASGAVLIDVRTQAEFQEGHLCGAINIPHDQLAMKLDGLNLDCDQPIILYCKSGGRSDFAMNLMQSRGFSKAVNAGGYEQLNKAINT